MTLCISMTMSSQYLSLNNIWKNHVSNIILKNRSKTKIICQSKTQTSNDELSICGGAYFCLLAESFLLLLASGRLAQAAKGSAHVRCLLPITDPCPVSRLEECCTVEKNLSQNCLQREVTLGKLKTEEEGTVSRWDLSQWASYKLRGWIAFLGGKLWVWNGKK